MLLTAAYGYVTARVCPCGGLTDMARSSIWMGILLRYGFVGEVIDGRSKCRIYVLEYFYQR